MWTWQGAIGVSAYDGVISPSYNVYRQRQDFYNPRYLDFLLREPALVDVYDSLSTGIRPSRRRLYPEEFLTIRFPLPKREEQDRIVNFLAEKSSEIDKVVTVRQKQIDELEELKKAIIHRAVTGGVGNTPLANEWQMRRLKTIVSCNDDTLSEDTSPERQIEYVEISDVTETQGIFNSTIYVFKDAPSRARRITRKDDVIVSTVRTYLKAIATVDRDGLIVSTGFAVLRAKPEVNSRFLSYAVKSETLKDDIIRNSIGVSYPAINATDLIKLSIPLPPLPVQREIVAYLDEKCAAIDKAIENRKAAIEELTALKSRIIADAVTGRMEVE
ncbi:MAG: restriction endonuclease subunit S [Kiritimatiellae bacterium]|nr:restriction endonuclease subunit S [Kiritimatiellia bacterium]